jgi:glycosyltransferase EpsJ
MHNAAGFMLPCIESLRAQTLSDIEFVLVDDFSSDSTADAARLAVGNDRRFIVQERFANEGPHQARVQGFSASTGRYVGFVDIDDRVAPEAFQLMFEAAERHEADMVICGALAEPSGRQRVAVPNGVHEQRLLERFVSMEFGIGSLWNKLYRRSILEQNPTMTRDNGLFVDRSEDYIVNAGAFFLARRVVTMSETLYVAVERPGSISRSVGKGRKLVGQLHACRVGMSAYRKQREVARLLGMSFVRRLALKDFRPPLRELVPRLPAVFRHVMGISVQDRQVGAATARRILGILRDSV